MCDEEFIFKSKQTDNFIKILKNVKNNVMIKEYNIDENAVDKFCEMFNILLNTCTCKKWIFHYKNNEKYSNYNIEDWKTLLDSDHIEEIIENNIKIIIKNNVKYICESVNSKFSNYLELSIDNKIVLIERYSVDNDAIQEFGQILLTAFNVIKNRGGEVHGQYVTKDEWEQNLKQDDRWEIIEENNDVIYIGCDINDAPECIIGGMMPNYV